MHQRCNTKTESGVTNKTYQVIIKNCSVQFSHVWLFVTPWTAAHQASLSITNSWSLFKLMSIESVMPSNHLILCHPLLLLPSIFPSMGVFFNESVLHIRWPKYWSFSFSISPSNEYSGLISFRLDWLDLLAPPHNAEAKTVQREREPNWTRAPTEGFTVKTQPELSLGGWVRAQLHSQMGEGHSTQREQHVQSDTVYESGFKLPSHNCLSHINHISFETGISTDKIVWAGSYFRNHLSNPCI